MVKARAALDFHDHFTTHERSFFMWALLIHTAIMQDLLNITVSSSSSLGTRVELGWL
jgi:hypothetical protein